MKRIMLTAATASLFLVAGPSFAKDTEYAFDVVDYPGALATVLSAVNDRGQIVGQFTDAALRGHAIYGEPGHLFPVDPDGVVGKSAFSAAYTLNNIGVVGGSYSANPSLGRGDHGYLLWNGNVETVRYPGGFDTEVYGVNDFGQVIGGYFTPDGNVHAYELVNGVFTAEDVPGSLSTAPLAINDRGQIAGFYVTVAGTAGQGYVREPDGTIRTFNAPGAAPDGTQLLYINDRDDTLGTFVDATGATVNFLRSRDEIDPVVAPTSLGAATFSPQAVNDFGALAGFFTDAQNRFHGFVAVPSR